MRDLEVVIAGGGIGGLTAALCLAARGQQVRLLEQSPEFAEVGAGLQLSPNCSRVLHYLGLEDALQAVAFLPEATEFRQWQTGHIINRSPLGAAVAERYGAPYYHVHRGDLLGLLESAARAEPAIELVTGQRVTGFMHDDSGVRVMSGDVDYKADVLVGADGIHSVVRDVLWGEQAPSFTGNVAWRALVPAECLPKQRIRPVTTAWWGPHKHFVHYYVRRGEFVNCVCVVEKRGWEVESWTEPGDYDELRSDFAGWHDDVQILLEAMHRDSLFKWALFDRAPMGSWSRGSVTLLGDACHPTLPFMAQGAAMAIEDAAVLAGCLQLADEVSAGLLHYDSLRQPRTAGVQRGSRRNARTYHLSGGAAWLRDRAVGVAGGLVMHNLYRYDALEAPFS